MKLTWLHAITLFAFYNLLGCSSSFSTDSQSTTTVAESSYCGTSKSISGGTYTVTGSAVFESRITKDSGTKWYLDYTFNTTAIAKAEINVYDAGNNLIQCGETAVDGTFSVQIPNTANQQYTLKVLSRANNSTYKASVLNDVNNNQPYAVSKSFTVANSSPGNIGTLTAEGDDLVDSAIPGGAFNILNNIYKANEFLRSSAGVVGFTVAPKVTAYWKAGFNPNTYRGGSATQGISYYIPGYYQLYIQGGINGNVATADTDHFDDSIILHEYGHFLEDVYGKTDSPGGSHSGNAVIDPRLAWSEGWANYIQAAIKTSYTANTESSSYIDTFGYRPSSSVSVNSSSFGNMIVFALTDDPLSGLTDDRPNLASEGMFREVSISRTLYKTTSPTTVTYTYNSVSQNSIDVPFKYVWQAFSDGDTGVDGMHSSNRHFRSMGLFTGIFRTLLNASTDNGKLASWDTMAGEEKQPLNNLEYGANLVSGGACPISMTPAKNESSGNSLGSLSGVTVYASNQLASNDFYRYYYNGSTNPTITITYTQPGSPTVDLNIHVYMEDYVYFEDVYAALGETSPYIVASTTVSPGTNNGTKSVSLAGKPAGYYLINVKAKTTNTDGSDKLTSQVVTTLSYQLSNNGGQLCPQSL